MTVQSMKCRLSTDLCTRRGSLSGLPLSGVWSFFLVLLKAAFRDHLVGWVSVLSLLKEPDTLPFILARVPGIGGLEGGGILPPSHGESCLGVCLATSWGQTGGLPEEGSSVGVSEACLVHA